MTIRDSLSYQHIMEYEAKLKHIDEMLNSIESSGNTRPDRDDELKKIRRDRQKFTKSLFHIVMTKIY